jgi:hypothetical protein
MYLSSRKCHFSSGNNVFRPTYNICVLIAVNRWVRWLDVPKKSVFGVQVCGLRILFLPSSIVALRPYQMLYIMRAWKTLPKGKDSENLHLLTDDHLIRAQVAEWACVMISRMHVTPELHAVTEVYANRPCRWSRVSECFGSLWDVCHWWLIYVSGVSIKVRAERERERQHFVICIVCSWSMWAGWRSRYSDWLWVGRSGDRIPVWKRFSASVQTGTVAHPASSTVSTGSFPGLKSVRGETLTHHPFLVPWSRKGRAIPLLPLWAVRPVQSLSACTRVHFTLQ